MRTLVTVGLTLASLMMIQAKKHDLSNLCKDKSIAPTDESFIRPGFEVGMYKVMLKKWDTAVVKTDGKGKHDDRKWKHNACFKLSINKPQTGIIEKDGTCNYNMTNYANCIVVAGVGGPMSQDIWITKTDNQTYALLISCTGENDPHWHVLAPNPTFPKETENMLLTYLEGLGFDKEDAAPESDPARGSKLIKVDCIKPKSKGYSGK